MPKTHYFIKIFNVKRISFCKVCAVNVNAEKKMYGHAAFENKQT